MPEPKHHIWRSGMKAFCGRQLAPGFIITKADYLFDPDDRPKVCYRCQNIVTHLKRD